MKVTVDTKEETIIIQEATSLKDLKEEIPEKWSDYEIKLEAVNSNSRFPYVYKDKKRMTAPYWACTGLTLADGAHTVKV